MAMEVEGPDGGIIEFPDGTPDATIKAVMAKAYSGQQQLNSASTTIPEPTAEQPQRSFAQPMIAPEARGVTPGQDAMDSFGAGLVRGGIGMTMIPGNLETVGRMGVNYAAKKLMGAKDNVVSPEPILPNSRHAEQMLADIRGKELYQPQTTAGQYARTAGEFAPNAMFPAKGMMERVVNTAAPALMSETAGQLTEGSDYEGAARFAGAMFGNRGVSPNPIKDVERAKQVQVLKNEGVTAVSAGQTVGKMPLRWTEQALADLPFVGAAQRLNDRAGDQFTKAALKRVGVDGNRASAEVLEATSKRIGDVFEEVGRQAAVPITPKLVNEIKTIAARYDRVMEPSLKNNLPLAIADDVIKLLNPKAPGNMTGQQYLTWRSQIGEAARGAKDPRTEKALYAIQQRLDDGAERFLRGRGAPEIADKFKEARSQYRNLLIIQKAVSNGEKGALGIITPGALETATRQMQGVGQYTKGKGDMTSLARAGSAILRPLPNSGTPARAAVGGVLTTLGSIVGGGPIGAGLGVAVPAAVGRTVMSRPVQGWLKNQRAPTPTSRNPATIGNLAQWLASQSR